MNRFYWQNARLMHYGQEELARALDPTYVRRGRSYLREGCVVSLQRQDARVQARVRGSAGRVYECEVALARDSRGRLQVDGECTCPIGYNCKHVAAALLAAAGQPTNGTAGRPDALAQRWLDELRAARRDPESYPHDLNERLLYVLRLRDYPTGARVLTVEPQRARLLKDGGYGAASPYRSGGAAARFLRPSDHALLRQLQALGGFDYQLKGDWGVRLLEAMLQTGRCHWQSPQNPPLRPAAARPGSWRWQVDAAGLQRLVLDAGAGSATLPLTPPWYVDPATGDCGPVATELPPRLSAALANAPRLSAEAVEAIADQLRDLPVPEPARLRRERRSDVRPQPVLRLSSRRLDGWEPPVTPVYLQRLRRGVTSPWLDQARLAFDYLGREVPADDPADPLRVREGELLLELARARAAEAAAAEKLAELGFTPLTDGGLFERADDDSWLDFMYRDAPRLRAEGWRVEADPSFRFQLAEVGDWYADIDEADTDWFSLDLGVTVDGERLSLLPLLAAMLQRADPRAQRRLRELPDAAPVTLPLPDGRLLPLPAGRLRPLLATLLELYDPTGLERDGRVRLSRLHSAALAELEASGPVHWAGGEALRRLGEKLKDFRGIVRIEPPRGLEATLRDYQRHGLDWLQFLREYGLSGVLADDMGLGKTLQVLAHLLVEKEAGRADRPSLVVAPTSLLTNWRREAARFAPGLSVLTLHGPERTKRFGDIPRHDLVLTSYPLLVRDRAALEAHDFHLVVLDEAQYIKNPRAKAGLAARALDARQRLALSGTPLENHLGELWALFHFLMPGLLGERERFNRLYRTPIEKQHDAERQAQLRRRIAPFLLRRTKEAVARELPPKTELVQSVSLEGAQRDLYETVRLAMHARIREEVARKGWERSHIVVLDALLKLRQICCDPRLVKLDAGRRVKESAKLALLMDMLPALLDEGRRVLLFSQFTEMLALIEQALKPLKVPYVTLTGDSKDRATPVDRFQRGEVPLFLISLKAGGTGLNLTAADTVIHYDPWWNPAVERQATDRAHRIGQDKPVFVYKLICEGTVEERMLDLQARKAALSEAMLAGGAAAGTLSAEDLEGLLGPV